MLIITIFISLLFLMFLKNFCLETIFLSMFCILLKEIMNYPLMYNYLSFSTNMGFYDFMNFMLIILTFIIFYFMLQNSVIQMLKDKHYFLIHLIMLIILIFCFMQTNLMKFFILFEFSLVPIFMMVMGWGYQPERLNASLSMMLYTIFASLPLFILILLMNKNFYYMEFFNLKISVSNWSSKVFYIKEILSVMWIFSFLVKFPMYTVHLWLPKAHVEAPVNGSMILAGVLLKLGGYGLIRVLITMEPNNKMIIFIQSMAMLGGMFMAILCISQSDMKILIAYSSVAHMSLSISTLLMNSKLAFLGGFLMLLTHGFTSSALFMTANYMYIRSHTRNLMFNSGNLTMIPMLSLFFFIICMSNGGTPPFSSFLAEFLCVSSLVNMNMMSILSLSLILFFALAFNLILYKSSQHGQALNFFYENLSFNELLLLFLHTFIFILMVLNINMYC